MSSAHRQGRYYAGLVHLRNSTRLAIARLMSDAPVSVLTELVSIGDRESGIMAQ